MLKLKYCLFCLIIAFIFCRQGVCADGVATASGALTVNLHKVVPIVMAQSIDSNFVRTEDKVIAKLKEDLYYGKTLVAAKDSVLRGRIISCRYARTLSESLHNDDKLKSSAALGIKFEQLTVGNDILQINASPVHQQNTWVGADGFTYSITVDNQGRIVQAGKTLTQEQKNSYNVLRVATNAPVPGGMLVNLAAAPAVMGAVGAANPELAFSKPLEPTVSHKRLKGMAYGVVTNLPGAFVVQALVKKGENIVLNNGDQLMVELVINNQIIVPRLFPASSKVDIKVKNASNNSLPLKPQIEIFDQISDSN